MFWSNANTVANAIWAVFDTVAISATLVWGYRKALNHRREKSAEQVAKIAKLENKIEKSEVEESVNKQLEAFEEKFDTAIGDIKEVLGKINYAIFNAGKTGLVNKVDSIITELQEVKTDVAVLKARKTRGTSSSS